MEKKCKGALASRKWMSIYQKCLSAKVQKHLFSAAKVSVHSLSACIAIDANAHLRWALVN